MWHRIKRCCKVYFQVFHQSANPCCLLSLAPLCSPPGPGAGGGVPDSHWACGAPQDSHTGLSRAPCHHSVWRGGKEGVLWPSGCRDRSLGVMGSSARACPCLSTGCGSERQQRGGNSEVAQLAPLLAMGTSLVSRGRFSDDEPEGRMGQMGRVMEIYPSRAKGNAARKFLRCKWLYLENR